MISSIKIDVNNSRFRFKVPRPEVKIEKPCYLPKVKEAIDLSWPGILKEKYKYKRAKKAVLEDNFPKMVKLKQIPFRIP